MAILRQLSNMTWLDVELSPSRASLLSMVGAPSGLVVAASVLLSLNLR